MAASTRRAEAPAPQQGLSEHCISASLPCPEAAAARWLRLVSFLMAEAFAPRLAAALGRAAAAAVAIFWQLDFRWRGYVLVV